MANSEASARIRLKVGTMELEYEGDPSFLTGGIEALLVTMGDLSLKVPAEPPSLAETTEKVQPVIGANDNTAVNGGKYSFSTNTIASHLTAKNGPELIICAMAQLEIVQEKSYATRNEILNEMKSATTYYNSGMSSNMSKNLANLTKAKRINQISKDTYALGSAERKQVEAKVAEIG